MDTLSRRQSNKRKREIINYQYQKRMVLDIFTDPETLNDNRKYHDLLYIHKFNHLKQ